jgi:hypothetical protein
MAGVFVAGGHDGLRMVSADGVQWTDLQKGREGEVFHSAAFGAGGCLLAGRFGGSNLFAFSRDGVTWKQYLREAQYSKYLQGLAFARDEFIALGGDPVTVGASRPFVFRSRDGETWTENKPIDGKNVLRRLAWSGSRFAAVGDRGRRAYSADGDAWQDVPDTRAVDTLVDIAYGNGVFVGVGLHGLRMTSRDGATWEGRYPGEEGEHLNRILWTGKQFVAVGQGATYFSPDGAKWERRPNTNAPLTAAYGPGFYVGAAWKGRILKSADAVTWEPVFKAETHVEVVAFGVLAGRPG